MMKDQVIVRAAVPLLLLLAVGLTACTSNDKDEPNAAAKSASADTKQAASSPQESTVEAYTPGEAGGVATRVVKASATVSAIDPASRKITLSTEDGMRATFAAPAEMHNFDQLRVGDKVNATLREQLLVKVGQGQEASATHAGAVARAPKGAQPGAVAAEMFEVVATVKAIDPAQRTATLQFVDGKTAIVPVRKDVDLTKYKAGDSVVIQVMQQLTLLTERP